MLWWQTIGGTFKGYVKGYGDIIRIDGIIDYYFFDTFTDPASVREHTPFLNTSDPKKICRTYRLMTDLLATPYDIKDKWTTKFEAEIPVLSLFPLFDRLL